MKSLCFLALVLFAGVALATEAQDDPTKVKCSAFAALKIRQRGSGSCSGKAGASCVAIASAQDDFKEAYEVWFGTGKPCEKGNVEAAAQACARATAAVYAESVAAVECKLKGKAAGFACGWSISEGSAMAVAMAKAIAQAAADVTEIDGDAFCVADVEVESAAIAEAAASAQSKACVKGSGSSEDFQKAVVESVATALANAFVKATAKTCSESGAAAAAAVCEGKTLADVRKDIKEASTEKATTVAKVAEIFDCEGEVQSECCKPSYKPIMCNKGGVRWIRKKNYGPGQTRIWKGGKDTCRCYIPKV